MELSRHRDISLTVALCASLVVHAMLLFRAAEIYSSYAMLHTSLPAFAPQVAPSDLLVPVDIPDPWHRLGDSKGTGTAIADSPGAEKLIAPKSNQDQPFLSLDAAGPGDIGNDPSESLIPKGAAQGSAPQLPEMQQPPGPPTPFGFAVPAGEFSLPLAPKTQLAQQGGPPAEVASTSDSTERPGASESADPAPAGRLESDPTTVSGGVEFHPGGTSVRLGRAAKITRPRLTLASRADLSSGARPIIVLKIRTDPEGNVTHAEVFRSSGSLNVDQPCKLAAYNWWFEPPKDTKGKPVEDVFLFSIRFI